MADKTINDFAVITTDSTDHLLAQKASNLTGKVPFSQLETWLDYYRKTQYVSLSTGAPDAGKPIVLDGTGKIHSSMLSTIDLATVLTTGNTTGGTDIVLSSGDEITNEVDTDLNVSVATAGAGNPGTHLRLSAGSGGTGVTIGGNILMSPGSGSGGGATGVVRVLGNGDVTGDLDVGGKLTVAGLIDPTGLILNEAAAPSTAATEAALFVSDGTGGLTQNKLYIRPGSSGTPEKLVAPPTSPTMAIVDPNASDAADDADMTTPFLTIQGAVDIVPAGSTVLVTPKGSPYDEHVYVRKNLSLVAPGAGAAGSNAQAAVVSIIPTTNGAALFVTDATLASAQTLNARQLGLYDANFAADLVLDGGATVTRVDVRGIQFDANSSYPSIVAIGVADLGSFLSDGLYLRACGTREGYYFRNAHNLYARSCKFWSNNYLRNISYTEWEFTHDRRWFAKYDFAEPQPDLSKGSLNYWHCYMPGQHQVIDAFDVTMRNCYTQGFAAQYGGSGAAPDIETEGCVSRGGTVSMQDGATWTDYGSFIYGQATFVAGAYLSTITLRSTRLSHVPSDTGSRLVYTEEGGTLSLNSTITDNRGGEINAITEKVSPVGTDLVLIEDSAASYGKKKVQITNLGIGGSSVFEIDATPTPDQIQPLLANKGFTFIIGSQDTEDTGAAADDGRMFFDKNNNSFRAGRATGVEFNAVNRGAESAAFGLNCQAQGNQSLAAGDNSDALGDYSVAIGVGCTATDLNSQALGDTSQVLGAVSAQGGFAEGNFAWSYLYGHHAHASGTFQGIPGDVQYSRATLHALTTGAATSELFLDQSGTLTLDLPDDRTWAFEMLFGARQIGGTAGTVGNSAAYKAVGCIRRVSGVVTLVGAVTYTVIAEDDASWPTPVVDALSIRLRVRATGVVNQNIRWAATVHLTEIFQGI